MKKTYIILAFLLLAIVLLVIVLNRSSSRPDRTTEQRTGKEVSSEDQQPLRIQRTVPLQGAYHNPFLSLEITFNKPVKPEDISVVLTPVTAVRVLPGEDQFTLQVVPSEKFLPETSYALRINTEPPFSLQFVTEQSASNPPGWNELFGQSYEDYRKQFGAQDDALISIRRRAPISEKQFTLTYSYTNNTYTFTLKPPFAQSKEDAISWLKNQGVTDFTNLRIKWVEQP